MSPQVHITGMECLSPVRRMAVPSCARSKQLNTFLLGLNFYPTFKDFKRYTLACLHMLPARGSTS